jgi:hypothetical protein
MKVLRISVRISIPSLFFRVWSHQMNLPFIEKAVMEFDMRMFCFVAKRE